MWDNGNTDWGKLISSWTAERPLSSQISSVSQRRGKSCQILLTDWFWEEVCRSRFQNYKWLHEGPGFRKAQSFEELRQPEGETAAIQQRMVRDTQREQQGSDLQRLGNM
jgi:hypothetical protein